MPPSREVPCRCRRCCCSARSRRDRHDVFRHGACRGPRVRRSHAAGAERGRARGTLRRDGPRAGGAARGRLAGGGSRRVRPAEGYVRRQVDRWSKQYRGAQVGDVPAMDRLIDLATAHVPEDDETAIAHGDFRLGNLIYAPDAPRVAAVLDWELSTIGHPIADLAYSCLYWRLPPELGGLRGLDIPGLPSEAAFVAAYCRRSGRASLPDFEFFVAFSLFRWAAIAAGVYRRALDGNAADAAGLQAGEKFRHSPRSAGRWHRATDNLPLPWREGAGGGGRALPLPLPSPAKGGGRSAPCLALQGGSHAKNANHPDRDAAARRVPQPALGHGSHRCRAGRPGRNLLRRAHGGGGDARDGRPRRARRGPVRDRAAHAPAAAELRRLQIDRRGDARRLCLRRRAVGHSRPGDRAAGL